MPPRSAAVRRLMVPRRIADVVSDVDNPNHQPDDQQPHEPSRVGTRRNSDRADRDAQRHGDDGECHRRPGLPAPTLCWWLRPLLGEPRVHPCVYLPADLVQERLDDRFLVVRAEFLVDCCGSADFFG